jgi:hypothetical protein
VKNFESWPSRIGKKFHPNSKIAGGVLQGVRLAVDWLMKRKAKRHRA